MASLFQQNAQAPGFAKRISTIFDRRRGATAPDAGSTRATTTFEVPVFLSPSRYEPPNLRHDRTAPRLSMQSVMEAATYMADRLRPLTFPSSSRYSSPTSSPALVQERQATLPLHESPQSSSTSVGVSATTVSGTIRVNNAPRRRRKRRRDPIKLKMQALRRLSVAFGATLLITLITYLVLALTGTAVGTMFHILMVLLLLSLTGVFAHSAIRLLILSKTARQTSRDRRHVDRWHGQARVNRSFFGEIHSEESEHHNELVPEKAIRITTVEDEEAGFEGRSNGETVAQPPPVYGNFRSSKRINPNLVHWHKVPPSPLTPTYDEAMSDIHRVVGYRPPSYIESESGATRIVEIGRRDVDRALKNIHPLERERVAELRHNMI